MDNLEFLDSPEGENAETRPEDAAPQENAEQAETGGETEEATPEKPTPPRGPDGKFAKKEEASPEPVMVPLAALHETRDKVKSLEAQLASLTQPQRQQQPSVPDMFEDPEGFQAHIAGSVNGAVLNTTLNISEEITRQSVGNDLVDDVQRWGAEEFQRNPALAQQFYQQRNPYGFLVQQYQRQQSLSKLGDDPKQIEAFLAWKQAQEQLQQQPAQADPQQAEPPQSIASAPSAGGLQTSSIGPGVAFAETIK